MNIDRKSIISHRKSIKRANIYQILLSHQQIKN